MPPLATPTKSQQATLFDPNPPNKKKRPEEEENPLSEAITIPEPPERPPLPEYPRIDTSARQPPERNMDVRRKEALTALLAAAGAGIGAASDSPTLLNIGAGLSQGAAEQLEGREEEFRQKQRAFNEFLTEAQRFNREQAAREAEADFNRRLQQFEQQSETRQKAIEEKGDLAESQQDHLETLAEIGRRGEERRKTARVRNQQEQGQEDEDRGGPEDLLYSSEDLQSVEDYDTAIVDLSQRLAQLSEQTAGQDIPTDQTGEIQERMRTLSERISQLRFQRDKLAEQEGREPPSSSRQPAPRGSARDTTGAQTRGQEPRARTSAGGAGQSQGRQDVDPITQAARQQAAQVDTVTQADIGAAVQRYGANADEVRLLREIRRIQLNQ